MTAVSGRVAPALAAALTVGAGLGLRAVSPGPVGQAGGTALYAVLVYLLVLVIRPRTTPARTATVALAFCWAVELVQLTPWPAALSQQSTAARLVLGSTFDGRDMAAYAVGILLTWLVHVMRLRTTARG